MGTTPDLILTKPLAMLALVFGVVFSLLLLVILIKMINDYANGRRAKALYEQALQVAVNSLQAGIAS